MKKGDKIICNDDYYDYTFGLTKNKVYTIIDTFIRDTYEYVYITNDENHDTSYFAARFITLKYVRKQKLKKLNEICI